MARPQKVGVEYFPLDVDIDQDDKVAMVEALHDLKGFAIVIKLLMKIYKEGYYCEWTEREQILFARRVNVDINEVNVIINDSVKWGLFDESTFNEHQILTSKGIQARYLEIVKRRKEVEIVSEFLLIGQNHLKNYKNIVVVDINGVNVNINQINDNISTQSKVKESKVKESKVVVEDSTAATTKNKLSEIANAFENNGFGTINSFTKERLVDLCETYKEEWVLDAIKESVNSNVRNLNYVEAILKRWLAEGKNTERKGNYGKTKGSNRTDGSEYDEIGLTYEDLQSL